MKTEPVSNFDLIVIGSGIVGLAHAYEGVRRGLSVCVIERDDRCVGASIRNFGFVTVTGQGEGDTYRRAVASRAIWAEVAPEAGIEVILRGLWLAARRPEAVAVLEEFMQTSMRSGCELVSADQACIRAPELNRQALQAALYSSHELRVESRDAIPKLVNWLSSQWGVVFRFNESVHNIVAPVVTTSRATLQAERIVFCPGASLTGPFSERIAAYGLTRSKLQMMRLRPAKHFKLSGAIMSELSLVRYSGYAKLAGAELLRQRLLKEESDALAHGVHLIAVQSDDGSLVVGDSHHYHATPDPFFLSEIEKIVLRELQLTLAPQDYSVTERWIGEYPSSHSQDAIIDQPDSQTRMVIVSSGTGASTAFGLAMDVFEKW